MRNSNLAKIIFIFAIIGGLIVYVICMYKPDGTAENAVVEVGQSSKFSQEEIVKATECVKKRFKMTDCNMTRLYYDEEKSNKIVEDYINCGKGKSNGVKPENVIVLFSDFDVNGEGNNPVLPPNSKRKDYNWILIRDHKGGCWVIDDGGYI